LGKSLKTRTGKISKSDRGDAFLLWKVYQLSLTKNNTHKYFKPLTIIDVELRPLLMKEELLYKNLQRVQRSSMIGVDVGSDIRMLEKMVEDVRREIVDRATRLIQGFMDIAKSLGLDMDDVNGLIGLAGLLVYIKSTSYQKSVKYLGLYKVKGRDAWKMKKYSNKAQRYLARQLIQEGWRIQPGDKVGYIIIRGGGPLYRRVKPYFKASRNEVDWEYYLDKQVTQACMRILEPLGVKPEELKKTGEVSLTDFL
jgi:hypothetical protein